eukprot:jgi/Phyca11/62947/gw1.18.287.1
MQFCFPTLFPDGYGGFNPLEEEARLHDHGLSDFCAHLMKWHDRRFIMHGNFKFFCLNLVQRRQIDGLVKRVTVTDKIVRGSGLYWSNARDDLMSMIGNRV